jgi:hypothetical protein
MIFNWTVFGLGVLGGILAEIIKWYQLRELPAPPEYLKSWFYWAVTAFMALGGGVLAVIQNIDSTKPLLALNIGISAPLILKGLAAATPIKPPEGRPGPGKSTAPRLVDIIAGR